MEALIINMHASGNCEGRIFSGICRFVCLSVFQHDISKTDAASISKRDVEMFHHESWKPIYFGIQRSGGQGHKAQKHVVTLLWTR